MPSRLIISPSNWNTAGLRKGLREIYPSRALLELAAQRKVPITFGSDAHAPGEVGHAFGEALALARSGGYTHCALLPAAAHPRRR